MDVYAASKARAMTTPMAICLPVGVASGPFGRRGCVPKISCS
jgi:hypothetical protein